MVKVVTNLGLVHMGAVYKSNNGHHVVVITGVINLFNGSKVYSSEWRDGLRVDEFLEQYQLVTDDTIELS